MKNRLKNTLVGLKDIDPSINDVIKAYSETLSRLKSIKVTLSRL